MEVRVPDTESDYGGAFLDPVTITRVRFERKEALNPSVYKLADGSQGRIWIDAVNSEGAFEVPKGAKVQIGNASMQVIACETYKVAGSVHHWEADVK